MITSRQQRIALTLMARHEQRDSTMQLPVGFEEGVGDLRPFRPLYMNGKPVKRGDPRREAEIYGAMGQFSVFFINGQVMRDHREANSVRIQVLRDLTSRVRITRTRRKK